MPNFEDPASRIDRLLALQEPAIATAFLRMVSLIKSSLTLSQIADLIEGGRFEAALSTALRSVPLLGEAYVDSFIAAARDTARVLNLGLGEVHIVFDQTNVGAVNAMNANRLRLVQGFTQQQTEATRTALLRAIGEGMNPRDAARLFRDSIGLTPRQVQAVMNYRNALEQLDRGALSRALRDRRFDRTVEAAIRDGNQLSKKKIDAMVNRYRERYIKYRAETIARTEALRSVHQGVNAMYDQAIASGDLKASDLNREWNTAKDERVRDSHASMHGQVQSYGQPFVSGLGNLLEYPGDPNAPGEDTIQCRCAVGTRITSLQAVPA